MRAGCVLLGILVLPAAAAPPADLPAGLQACAAVTADAARLSCYDRLAGRGVSPAPAAPASPPSPERAASALATPTAAASEPASARPAAPAPAAVPAPSGGRSFGLYAAEHPPPPPVAKSMSARVVGVGTGADGHMTATLEGGELWELDDADPLLAAGDTVTISRAAFGSFLMQTPSKRTHRVRRLH